MKDEQYEIDVALWPIVIVQDRYRGTYTGAQWIAIPQADTFGDFETTVWGDDCDCMDWAESCIKKNKQVGLGDTPEEALSDLYETAEEFLRFKGVKTDVGDFMEPFEEIERLRSAIRAHKALVMANPGLTAQAEDQLWAVLEE